MLSFQIRATWEGWSRSKELKLRAAVSRFLELALVKEVVSDSASVATTSSSGSDLGSMTAWSMPSSGSDPRSAGLANPAPIDSIKGDQSLLPLAAVRKLVDLLEVDVALIIDLTCFHHVQSERSRPGMRRFSWLNDEATNATRVLASCSTPEFAQTRLEASWQNTRAMTAISSFLQHHSAVRRFLTVWDILRLRTLDRPSYLRLREFSSLWLGRLIAKSKHVTYGYPVLQ